MTEFIPEKEMTQGSYQRRYDRFIPVEGHDGVYHKEDGYFSVSAPNTFFSPLVLEHF
jgi:hypothetical protein